MSSSNLSTDGLQSIAADSGGAGLRIHQLSVHRAFGPAASVTCSLKDSPSGKMSGLGEPQTQGEEVRSPSMDGSTAVRDDSCHARSS